MEFLQGATRKRQKQGNIYRDLIHLWLTLYKAALSTRAELCWSTSSPISCVPMDQIYWRMHPTSFHWSYSKPGKLQALISVCDTTSLFLLPHLFELSFGRACILPLALKENKQTRLNLCMSVCSLQLHAVKVLPHSQPQTGLKFPAVFVLS